MAEPPRATPRLVTADSDAPLRHEKTPATFLITKQYLDKKLGGRSRKQLGLGAAVTLLLGGYEKYREYDEDQKLRAAEVRTAQKLDDHIAEEAKHHAETLERLNQLLDYELGKKR